MVVKEANCFSAREPIQSLGGKQRIPTLRCGSCVVLKLCVDTSKWLFYALSSSVCTALLLFCRNIRQVTVTCNELYCSCVCFFPTVAEVLFFRRQRNSEKSAVICAGLWRGVCCKTHKQQVVFSFARYSAWHTVRYAVRSNGRNGTLLCSTSVQIHKNNFHHTFMTPWLSGVSNSTPTHFRLGCPSWWKIMFSAEYPSWEIYSLTSEYERRLLIYKIATFGLFHTSLKSGYPL